jgi:repressor LexA
VIHKVIDGERSFTYTWVMNEIISKLKSFHQREGRMPSYLELAKLAGYSSKQAAYRLGQKLIDNNYLTKDNSGKLTAGPLLKSIRILGLIEAGFPTEIDEELEDTTTLDDWLLGNKEASYMLKVKGDSMIKAGIHEGDFVVVERSKNAQVGQIVVAQIDGQWTLKTLRKDRQGFYLEAQNPRFKPMRPIESLDIAAFVTAVIRKY